MGSLTVVPVSPVNFKKWQCRMSLSLIHAHVACQIYKMITSHVTVFTAPCRMYNQAFCRLLIQRNGRVPVSNLGVKGHQIVSYSHRQMPCLFTCKQLTTNCNQTPWLCICSHEMSVFYKYGEYTLMAGATVGRNSIDGAAFIVL